MKVQATETDELLGETVWVKLGNTELEGLVIKENPNIIVKLDNIEDTVSYNRNQIWIRNPQGRNGRPVK